MDLITFIIFFSNFDEYVLSFQTTAPILLWVLFTGNIKYIEV